MPPFVGRKRSSISPLPTPQPPAKRARTIATSASGPIPRLQKKASRLTVSSDSDSSSLSDVDSNEFEHVPQSGKNARPKKSIAGKDEAEDDDDDEDEDMEWEDAPTRSAIPDFSKRDFKDVNLTFQGVEGPDYTARGGAKKGPSKREKQARLWAHQMHVQFLLWHNAKRNEWVNDRTVQNILLKQLPSQIVKEIEKWKKASGLTKDEDEKPVPKDKKKKIKKWMANGERSERDWGRPSQKLEHGKPDMSHGDPIISLLRVLAAYWKKRFAITAPGLRKRGWGTRLGLRKDVESYQKEKHHPAKYGEKIESLDHFCQLAEKSEGSRDVGAQLFVALLRAIGIETRMVASLQPVGFGFTKTEEMVARRMVDPELPSASDHDRNDEPRKTSVSTSRKKAILVGKKSSTQSRRSGGKTAPIHVDTDVDEGGVAEDDDSVVDVTPVMPRARPAKYDRDLAFPIYWAEAISPITARVYPVSPLVIEQAVATSAEIVSLFEPKGVKAEKTRQVMAYVVAYSQDFTAKDVTVRYLRKNIWPGKTKGFRVPVLKTPIYNEQGKIKRHEEYDWFSDVLCKYERPRSKRTTVDDAEEASDLLPAEPEKKQAEGDTLQSLKSSTDFALERYLRREEALVPGAKVVRHFIVGKGDKQENLPVYSRKDVRRVMTAESWHKEGRVPKDGEAPMKLAPVRAVTATRKREAEEHLRMTGEKQMQGLYCQEQTTWIIPPPIVDGKIPKNGYGNIDCFVPSMVPKGAIHLPLKGCVRICKKLEIDFSEAVVGFEFGNRMAVPVIQGVVIAKENERVVRDAWRVWGEEQRKKEETKMEKLVLEMWRKFVIGLRIRDRVNDEYGIELAQTDLHKGVTRDEPIQVDENEPAGGFVANSHDEFGGGFLVDHEDDFHAGAELTLEHHTASQEKQASYVDNGDETDIDASQEYPTPVSASISTKIPTRKNQRLSVRNGESDELSDVDIVQEDETTADGYLQDDEDDLPLSVRKSATRHISSSKPPANVLDSEQESTPQSQARSRGRPRKAAARRIPNTVSARKTRNTPARSAKSQAQSMHADDAADCDSEADDTERDDSTTTKTEKKPTRKRGRRRPWNSEAVETSSATPKRGKRLLRKESTIVTSPYFGSDL